MSGSFLPGTLTGILNARDRDTVTNRRSAEEFRRVIFFPLLLTHEFFFQRARTGRFSLCRSKEKQKRPCLIIMVSGRVRDPEIFLLFVQN